MRCGIIRKNGRSKKGITLTELIVAMTMTAIFAVICIALINPISNLYQKTVKLSRAQLLADSIVDGIRRECDGIKFDDKNSVWIANFDESKDDELDLLSDGPKVLRASNTTGGNALIIQKNNNYAEAIYSCVSISEKDLQKVQELDYGGQKNGHAVEALFKAGTDNLKKGKVHFGYYKAKENDEGVFPFQAYDYTNPVLASTYGKYTVELKFTNLTFKEITEGTETRKTPSYVECQIKVYDGDCSDSDVLFKGPIYTRTTVISFSANGSGVGTGSSSHLAPDKKTDIDVRIVWVNEKNEPINWPDKIASTNVSLFVNGILQRQFAASKDRSSFRFLDVEFDDNANVELLPSDLKDYGYTVTYSGKPSTGYVITYKQNVKTVKLVCGEWFSNQLLGNKETIRAQIKNIVFGSKAQWAEAVKNVTGTKVAIPYDAPLDKKEPSSRRQDDYMFYKVPDSDGKVTVYVLSNDGTFVFNEDCTKMFQNCVNVKTITGITGPGTDTSIFDTSLVQTMKSMFESCASIENFEMPGFVTSTCISTQGMFKGCASVLTYDFSRWDTSKVENMSYMFDYFHSVRNDGFGSDEPFVLNVSDLSFDSCTNMKYMFAADADEYPISVSSHNLTKIILPKNINTSKVTNMQGAFAKNKNLVQIVYLDQLDGDKITTCKGMFLDCQKLENVTMPGFVHSGCSSLESMFENCFALKEAVFSDWNTSGVTTIKYMFKGDKELGSVTGLSGSNFAKLTDCDSPFSGCTKLTDLNISGIEIPKITSSDTFKKMFNGSYIENLNMSEAKLGLSSFDNLFKSYTQFKTIDFSNVIAGNVSAKSMFMGCTGLTSVNIAATNSNSFNLTNAYQMFRGCTNLTDLTFNGLITSHCTNTSEMFYGCTGFTGLSFDEVDFSGVTTIKNMFYGDTELASIAGLNGKDFSALTDCDSPFSGCTKLFNLNISGIKIPSITSSDTFKLMFKGSSIKNLDMSVATLGLSSFDNLFKSYTQFETIDFSNVIAIAGNVSAKSMFMGCTGLTSVNIAATNSNSFNLTDAYQMFRGCTSLESVNIEKLISKKSKNIEEMFYDCSVLPEISFKGSDFSGLESMRDLCRGCKELKTLDLKTDCVTSTNLINCQSIARMCSKLETVRISGLCVSSFQQAFEECNDLTTADLSDIDGSKCTTLASMFHNCYKLKEFDFNCFKRGSDGILNLSKVTAIHKMFSQCLSLNSIKNMNKIDFSSILNEYTHVDFNSGAETIYKSLSDAFESCTELHELDISGIQLPKINDSAALMSLFSKSSIKRLYMSGAKLGLTSFEELFKSFVLLEYLDFSNVIAGSAIVSTQGMFNGCSNLTQVVFESNGTNSFKTNNTSQMFKGCSHLTSFNLASLANGTKDGKYDLTNITTVASMFQNCSSLTSVEMNNIDLAGLTNNDSISNIFNGCSNLITLDMSGIHLPSTVTALTNFLSGSGVETLKLNDAKLDLTSLSSSFSGNTKIKTIEMSNVITGSAIVSTQAMFKGCTNLTQVVFGSNGTNTFKTNNASEMFSGCSNLTSFSTNGLISSDCTDLSSMFYSCSKLTTIDLTKLALETTDGRYDLTNITTVASMFQNCSSLTSVEMKNIDLAGLTSNDSISNIFNGCSKLITLDMSGIHLPSTVTALNNFLSGSGVETLKLNDAKLDLDTLNATFSGNTKLKTFEMSNATVSNVESCASMFQGCTKLETITMDGFNAEKCTDMSFMFKNCVSVRGNVDLSNWNTSNVSNMASMFENFAANTGSRTVYSGDSGYVYLDISDFDFSNVEYCNQMFNVEKNTYADYLKQITLPSTSSAMKLTTTKQMFRNRTSLERIVNLGNFATSSALTDAMSTFADCRAIETIDVSSMNFSGVTEAKYMFNAAKDKGSTLKTIYVSSNPGYAFNPSILTTDNSKNMFENRNNLVGGRGTGYNAKFINVTYARIDEGPSSESPGYFSVK